MNKPDAALCDPKSSFPGPVISLATTVDDQHVKIGIAFRYIELSSSLYYVSALRHGRPACRKMSFLQTENFNSVTHLVLGTGPELFSMKTKTAVIAGHRHLEQRYDQHLIKLPNFSLTTPQPLPLRSNTWNYGCNGNTCPTTSPIPSFRKTHDCHVIYKSCHQPTTTSSI